MPGPFSILGGSGLPSRCLVLLLLGRLSLASNHWSASIGIPRTPNPRRAGTLSDAAPDRPRIAPLPRMSPLTRNKNVRAFQSRMVTPVANSLFILLALLIAAAVFWVYDDIWAVDMAYNNKLRCGAMWCPENYDKALGVVFPAAIGKNDLLPIRRDNYSFHRSVLNLLMNAGINQASVEAPPGTTPVLRVDRRGRPCMAFGVASARKMVVVLRGLTDLRDDFDFRQIEVSPGVWVHEGYQLDYEDISTEIFEIVRREGPEMLVFAGHSLGGALSVLLARGAEALFPGVVVAVVSYGTPRVGNENFAESMKNTTHVRIENEADIVPSLPPSVSPNSARPSTPFMYCHSGEAQHFQSNWLSLCKNHSLGCYKSWLDSLGETFYNRVDSPQEPRR